MTTKQTYDCIVIGAGPAGLSASLFLARYRRSVLTFHHNYPRNLYAHGVHGFLGHDGILPEELLARGRGEVTKYGGLIVEGCVTSVEMAGDEHFRVSTGGEEANANTSERSYEARRLLLATGLRDLTPDCPGFLDFYGTTVHHCPDCDGYEVSDRRVVVLSSGADAIGFTIGLLNWTDKLTLITNRDETGITSEHRAKLAQLGIPILSRRVVALEGDIKTRQVARACLDDGNAIDCDALFFNFGVEISGNLHQTLGCKLDEECGLVWVDDEQQTSVRGVYAAGDITPHSQLAIVAAAEGAMAAIHINKSLVKKEHLL